MNLLRFLCWIHIHKYKVEMGIDLGGDRHDAIYFTQCSRCNKKSSIIQW